MRVSGTKRRRGSGGPPLKKPRVVFRAPRNGAAGRRRRNARIGGFLGIEFKFYDTSLANSALTAPTDASGGEHNPSATICLNSVTQGDGESQRDGRNIVMKKLHLSEHIYVAGQANQTATDPAPVVYIALVWDKQTNGALLNSEDVFTNPSGNAFLAANPMRNLQYIKRFKVLKSVTLQLIQPTGTYDGTNIETGGYMIPFRMDLDLPNIEVNYTGTTETIANIVDNSLNIVAYAANISIAPVLYYNCRLRFVG